MIAGHARSPVVLVSLDQKTPFRGSALLLNLPDSALPFSLSPSMRRPAPFAMLPCCP